MPALSIHEKKKILWFSNAILSDGDICTTGTWLGSLAQQLAASEKIVLGNISMGKVKKTSRQDCGSIKQWVIPAAIPSARTGLPPKKIVAEILRAVEEFDADLVHIWGTECYWGLLTARKMIEEPALLGPQGLKFAIASAYSGGLSFTEQLACVGLKEILRRTTLPQGKKSFKRWGELEKEIISKHQDISVQTSWVEAHVRQINSTAKIWRNGRILRKPFYSTPPWKYHGNPTIFFIAAYSSPFKGLHVVLRAVALLKKSFPEIKLRIAGVHQRKGFRRDGYISWINHEAQRLGVTEDLIWLGPLSALEIVRELQNCSAFVIASFIESHCISLVEAMQVGVPAVVSFAGGTPGLAKDEESALFFPVGDEIMCAWQLARILANRDLASRLSYNARATTRERYNPEKIIEQQLEIYQQVIAESSGDHKC